MVTPDCVIDAENVVRVECVLDLLLEFNGHSWKCAVDKALAKFANAVVVRDAATGIHHFVTCSIFYNLIFMYDLVTGLVLVRQRQVHVDGWTCRVKLCDAEGDPDVLFFETFFQCFFHDPCSCSLAELTAL